MIEEIGTNFIALILPAFIIAVYIPFFRTLFEILAERKLNKSEKQWCYVTAFVFPLSLFNAICMTIIHWHPK